MALFFHSDEVDQLIPIQDAVRITEDELRDMTSPAGVCAPRKRLNLHRDFAEGVEPAKIKSMTLTMFRPCASDKLFSIK